MTKPPNDIESIYSAALTKTDKLEHEAYLNEACAGKPELRKRVEALLNAHDQAEQFLETPPPFVNAAPVEVAISESPGALIGRYKLLEKIGEGGMAVVYMAEQEQPIRRKVALKIIKLGMDTKQVIARFEAERQALALMDHPNIAKVLDAGATETGRPYFVMELVTGVSITEFCDKNMLSTKERLTLFIQVCNAVQHAHQKGIIHRDLKPTNIMVTQHEGQPVPKVIDFGIAKATNQRLTEKTLFTRYAHIIGTPAYMSPEQAELSDLDVDTRSDIYSLGVLIYELLTGTTPFSEEELRKAGYAEMTRIIREEEPLRPSTRLTQILAHTSPKIAYPKSKIENDLDWIVMKTLEKSRDRRYDNVSALALDVQRHLSDEPILARAPSTLYQLQKFLQRHRSQTVSGIIIGFLCIAIATVLSLRRWNDLKEAMVEAADHKSAMYRANLFLTQGRPGNALADLERLLSSEHVGADARRLHDRLMALARQNTAYYTTEIETDPDNLLHYLKRAQNHYYINEMDQVRRDMARYSDMLNPLQGTEAYDRYVKNLQSQQQETGFVFATPANLGPPVNTVYAQFGAHVSPDGLTLHFSDGGPWPADPAGYGGGDLWISTREDLESSWEAPRNLGSIVNSPYPDSFPSITPDGKALYFFSDRPDGLGEPDLYVSERSASDVPWGRPRNLGFGVNSATGDVYPHISADNLTLYYCSYRSGNGDIYVATRSSTEDSFGLAENIGSPVNTVDGEEGDPWISLNACLLFFTRCGRTGIDGIFLSRRESTQHPWSEPVNLGLPVCKGGVSGASFTADGKRFFFHGSHVGSFGNTDIWEARVLQALEGFFEQGKQGLGGIKGEM